MEVPCVIRPVWFLAWGGLVSVFLNLGAGAVVLGGDHPDRGAPALSAAAQRAQTPPSGIVRLRSGDFVPLGTVAGNLAHVKQNTPYGAALRVLLRLEPHRGGPVRPRLERAGVRVLGVAGGGTLVASLSSDVEPAVLREAGVEWVGGIYPEDKIAPWILSGGPGGWALRDGGTVDLQVRVHGDADMEAVIAAVGRLGGVVMRAEADTQRVTVNLPVQSIRDVADLGDVAWVEEVPPPAQTFNDGVRAMSQADQVQATPYDLTGAGTVLGVCDEGEVDSEHQDFAGRLVLQETSKVVAHSTHVAGTMAGSGARSAASGGQDGQWRGVAPGARIVSFSFADPIPKHNPLINVYGGRLSQNSWGALIDPFYANCGQLGYYGWWAPDYDRVVTGLYGRPLTVVFAGGNYRRGTSTNACSAGPYGVMPPPGTAKDVITVGAINSNDGSMTFFSSWGPTDDGRLKPELVAPGGEVGGDLGVTSTLPGNRYGALSGTSMAAPVVSGAIALLMEEYSRQFPGEEPPPAFFKALLVHTAKDLNGGSSWYNEGPDFASGYGQVQMRDAVDQLRAHGFLFGRVQHAVTNRYTIAIPEGTARARFTLAWDDPAGLENAAVSLVNDLDLVVLDPDGVRYYPWTLDPLNPSAPAARTIEDRLNVVEQVEVGGAVRAGDWTVMVVGYSVTGSDAQDYTLVATPSAGVLQPQLKFLTTTAAELAPAAANGNGAVDPGEEMTLQCVLQNLFVPAITNLSIQLESLTPGVSVLDGALSLPAVAPHAIVSNTEPFRVRVGKDVPCGGELRFRLVATADGTTTADAFVMSLGHYVVTNEATQSYESADVPLALPDLATQTSTLVVTGSGSLTNIQVFVRADHTWAGDLQWELVHPDGTRVVLLPATGNQGQNVGSGECGPGVGYCVFDDAATTNILASAAPYVGFFRPANPLAALLGKPAAGTWRLRVTDLGAGDTGTLKCWGILLGYREAGYVCEPFNRAPLALAQTTNVVFGRATRIALQADDPDADPLVFQVVQPPAHGVLSDLDAQAGTVVYTPAADFSGPDTFTFEVSDGLVSSATAVVSLEVQAAAADLAIAGVDGLSLAGVGLPQVWTVTVTNSGPNTATAVTLRSSFSNTLEVVEASASQGAVLAAGNNFAWDLGAMASESNAWVRLVLRGTAPGVVTNAFEVSAAEVDPFPGNNLDQVVCELRLATDVGVWKSVGSERAAMGGEVRYEVGVTNVGLNGAHGVVVVEQMPAGVSLEGWEAGLGEASVVGGQLEWRVGELGAGMGSVLGLTGRAVGVGVWTNRVEVGMEEVDVGAGNDIAEAVVEVEASADLGVEVGGAGQWLLGQERVVTVGVTNAGPSEASGVLVSGVTGEGLELVGWTEGVLVETNGVGGWSWAVGTMGVGSNAVVEMRWKGMGLGLWTNAVTVSGAELDGATGNNAAEWVAEVVPGADVRVGLSGPGKLVEGAEGTWEVGVTNAGPSEASGVIVSGMTGAGLELVGWTEGVSVETNGVGGWSWAVGTMGAGSNAVVTLRMVGRELGDWTNVVSVVGGEADPEGTNNVAELTTMVRLAAEVGITLDGGSHTLFVDSVAVLGVRITNAGPSEATGTVVSYRVPEGVTLEGFEPPTVIWTNASGLVSWDVPQLSAGTETNYQIHVRYGSIGSVTHSVFVVTDAIDSDSSNDSAEWVAQVVPGADVRVGLSGPGKLVEGAEGTWEVGVTNAGPSEASGVIVSGQTGAGLELVGWTEGVLVETNGVGGWSWAVGAMGVGSNAVVTLRMVGRELGDWTNVVSVAGGEADPEGTNNVAELTTMVRLATDVGVWKSVGSERAAMGGEVRYEVGVTNVGVNGAHGVVVVEQMPAGVSLEGWEAGLGEASVVGGQLEWRVGELGAGMGSVLGLRGRAVGVGVWTNRVEVRMDGVDEGEGNDVAEAVVEVEASADLGVEVGGAGQWLLGQERVVTVGVTNAGPSEASGVLVSGVTGEGLELVGWTEGVSVETNGVGGWSWAVGTMGVGSNAVVEMRWKGMGLGMWTNAVTVSGAELDGAPENNAAEWVAQVVPGADVRVGLSGPGKLVEGAEGTWEVGVTNAGPSEASGVIVSGMTGAGLELVGWTEGVSVETNGVGGWSWAVGTMGAGSNAVVTLRMVGRELGDWTNVVSVVGGEADPEGTNNVAELGTMVRLATDVGVWKSVGSERAAMGGEVRYEVGVTNVGLNGAHGVVVVEQMPAGVSLEGWEAGLGEASVVGGQLEWRVGELGAGMGSVLGLRGRAVGVGVWTNRVEVGMEEVDVGAGNDIAEAVVEVEASADLGVEVGGAGQWLLGQERVVTVGVTNAGPSESSGVMVSGVTGEGLELVGWTEGVPVETNGVGGWSWAVGTMGVGSNAVVEMRWKGMGLGVWTNAVTVGGAELDGAPGNNAAEWVAEVVPSADLTLGVVGTTNLVATDAATETVTVTNAGPSTATDVVVTGMSGGGVEVVGWPEDAQVVTNASGGWQWMVGSLGPGEGASLSLAVVAARAGLTTNILGVAAVEADPVPADNESSLTYEVQRLARVSVSQVGPSVPVLVGRAAVYVVQVTNAGPSEVVDVELRDVLPEGTRFIQAEPSAGEWSTEDEATLRWLPGVLPAGAVESLRIVVMPEMAGVMTNGAVATGTYVDPEVADDRSEWATEVFPVARMSVGMTSFPEPVMINDLLHYTLMVTNEAAYTVPDASLVDDLPPGIDVASWSSSQGAVTLNGETLIFDLGSLAPAQRASMTLAVRPRQLGVITNVARVVSAYVDPADPGLVARGATTVLREPPLKIEMVGGRLEFSWPLVADAYNLEYTRSLGPDVLWLSASAAPAPEGERWVVRLKPIEAVRFYRLAKPAP